MTTHRPIRVALVADGDPTIRATNSGVAAGLLDGLKADGRVEVVETIDSTPTRPRLIVLAVNAMLRSPRRWKALFRKGSMARHARSKRRDYLLRGSAAEVVIHVRNTYEPCRLPYVNFLDNVSSLSQREWEPWALPDREYAARVRAETIQFNSSLAIYTAGRHVKLEISRQYDQPADRVVAIGGGLNPLPPAPHSRVPGKIVFVGYDFNRKGGQVLLEALTLLPHLDLQLVIVGPEPTSSADSRITWEGRISNRDALARLYASASVFVLPALFEPYGLVVAEAMHSGLPCIVSDSNELPNFIANGESGLVVPRGDPHALAEALRWMLTHPVEAASMGARARTDVVAQGLDWNHVATRMVDDLVTRKRGGEL